MDISSDTLLEIFPRSGPMSALYAPFISQVFARFSMNTLKRQAAFLAQVGHESAQLTYVVENLNYSAQGLAATWPNRYSDVNGQPNTLALSLARDPIRIANNAYANRNGNGNEASGDGWRYRGRGLIQVTGRANYRKLSSTLGVDLELYPERLEEPRYAVFSAGQYWADNNLNALADNDDIEAITRRINGGLNGLSDRKALYTRALEILSA
ncbi:glycoside hydrolase family 19 protein [Pseudomonas aeruginosa]|uniref:glycoside hydrolase family 19 protein n=1 Tax=Pseudomonas aeruginosa TaxID=287 RepID=UPI003D2DB554